MTSSRRVEIRTDDNGMQVVDPATGQVLGEMRWFATTETRLGPLVQYPPPEHHPDCQCRGDRMRAFFCTTGHMRECHYPKACDEARCMHLLKYDDAE